MEFLTDRKSRRAGEQNVIVAGVSAQPLAYVEMSREAPLRFSTSQGAALLVVAPAPWIFHKALTFPRRRSSEKKAKDLYGIWYVGSQLGEFSKAALEDLKELTKVKHPNWRLTAKKNLKQWISRAAPADWELLQVQDPEHLLTRARFERFFEETLACGPAKPETGSV